MEFWKREDGRKKGRKSLKEGSKTKFLQVMLLLFPFRGLGDSRVDVVPNELLHGYLCPRPHQHRVSVHRNEIRNLRSGLHRRRPWHPQQPHVPGQHGDGLPSANCLINKPSTSLGGEKRPQKMLNICQNSGCYVPLCSWKKCGGRGWMPREGGG